MLLAELLKEITIIPSRADRDISQLSLDSRTIQANDLFLAISGTQSDGRNYIDQAIKNGAIAVLVDAPSHANIDWHHDIPLIPIPQLAQHVGILAARFFNYPANQLHLIGVTGTSGKTSCTHFIAQILQTLNIPCGLIGTLGNGFYGALSAAKLTTPDAINLQATLRQFNDKGAQAVAMEVSSHSIDQGRINGLHFETGIFTNLTQDHLDYHGDMETYAAVKRRFLVEFPLKNVVVNLDDERGNKWFTELPSTSHAISYSTQHAHADIYASDASFSFEGIAANMVTPWGKGELKLPLIGQFNLSNALAVTAALGLYGISLNDILKQLSRVKPVPGRMQTLGGGNQPLVVVDYAHKPDALQKVLQTLRSHIQGKLICVFGCGGERDQSKRPLMAKIAEQLADQIIVTNDNPRHEDPKSIVADIVKGFAKPERVTIELDRSKAIKNSIQWAKAGDCVLIAGKGAENYQQIGDTSVPFDDVEHVKEYLGVR